MKKIIALLVTVVLAVAVCGCGKQDTGLPTIGIIQPVQHAALDAASEGFIQALADNGYVDGETVKIDLQNGQGDTSNLSTIADGFVSANVDMILAVGTGAAQAVAGKTTSIPILGTAITDYETAKLVDSNAAPGGNVTGTSDMNPVDAQIRLVLELAPDTKTIGLLYSSSEDNSILQTNIAKASIEALGLSYAEVTVNNSNDVQQAVQQLVGMCDAIYIPTDNTVASAMPVVYSVTVAAKMPVICGENNMALAGGLASLGVDYYKLGYQTGVMAVRVLKGEAEVATTPVEFAEGTTPVINSTVAEEIGMTIPDAYLPYAAEMTAAQ